MTVPPRSFLTPEQAERVTREWFGRMFGAGNTHGTRELMNLLRDETLQPLYRRAGVCAVALSEEDLLALDPSLSREEAAMLLARDWAEEAAGARELLLRAVGEFLAARRNGGSG